MKYIKLTFIFMILFFNFSCENKEKEKLKNFCLNITNKKTAEDCEKCLSILDENKNKLSKTDYTNKKLQYYLLLKEYENARKFINEQEFKFNQEKQIRLMEINLVESYCLKKNFAKIKQEILVYIEQEIIINKNIEIINLLKGEKSNVQSDLIVEYFCTK